MGKLFDLDSPIMRGLSRMADLIILNLLVLAFFLPALGVFSLTLNLNFPLPLVILLTWLFALLAGPAYTGMHYVLLKIVRDEEGYLVRGFFKSFRENFLQSIVLAGIVMAATGVLIADLYLLTTQAMASFPVVLRMGLLVAAAYLFMVALWIFPLEARFVNSVPGTLKNAFFISILALPRTLAMAAITLLPLLILYFFDMTAVPILIMFGIAAPAWVCALLYSKVFKRFEPETEAVASDEEFEVPMDDIDERDG